MKRREFICIGGCTLVAWPFPALTQQAPIRVIGFLGTVAESVWTKPVAAFEQQLREHGWIDGRTIKIVYRWAEGRTDHAGHRKTNSFAKACPCQGAALDRPTEAFVYRRRGDRITRKLLHCIWRLMALFLTSGRRRGMSAVGGKADIANKEHHVYC
jgi:hypothetical protein